MNLSPNPKPVKVRITSGGKEHSSLDSLLKCFKWEDLEKNEEQVRRWLRRQGKAGINIVSQWKEGQKANNAAGLFDIYKIFFDLRKQGVYSIDVLFDRWAKDKDGKTDNFTFLLDSLSSLNYKKALDYKTAKEQAKNGSLVKTKDRDSNPYLGKANVGIKQTMSRQMNNSDRELLEVHKIAEKYIRCPLTGGIVEDAKKEFGLKYLVDLTTRKDKIAAFFIALLIQRVNNKGNDFYHQHSYNLTGIVCCEKYNYMAQLLVKGEEFRRFKSAPQMYMNNTLSLFKFPQKVKDTFMSKPEIINWYAEMESDQLEMLWKFFCENINILEIK